MKDYLVIDGEADMLASKEEELINSYSHNGYELIAVKQVVFESERFFQQEYKVSRFYFKRISNGNTA